LTLKKIEGMARKAKASGVRFRPHFKTHRSAAIGEWFRRYGVASIAVSSVEMAKYFAQHGWNDVMVCIPANLRELDAMNALAETVDLHVLVDSLEAAEHLGSRIESEVNTWIEIDVGYRRTGVPAMDDARIQRIAHAIDRSPTLVLTGIITHAGHSYHAVSHEEIRRVHRDSVDQMAAVQDRLATAGFPEAEVSVGDTPSCSIVETFERPVDEIRPGNFVFYDLTQLNIGSCTEDDISMTVACPVISKHLDRAELVIYGGGTSLSKEYYTAHGRQVYGLIALPTDEDDRTPSRPGAYIASLSQEHGKVTGPPTFIADTRIGDVLLVLPVHACQAALLYGEYQTYEGERLSSFQVC
jgi:D-serine deaminase-like pyridoxal phosphate-dependent protein